MGGGGGGRAAAGAATPPPRTDGEGQFGTTGAAAHVDERPDEEQADPSRGRLGTAAGAGSDTAAGDATPRADKVAAARPAGRRLSALVGPLAGTDAAAAAENDGGCDRPDRGCDGGGEAPPPRSAPPAAGDGDAGVSGEGDGVPPRPAREEDEADEEEAAPVAPDAAARDGDGERRAAQAAGDVGHSPPSVVAATPVIPASPWTAHVREAGGCVAVVAAAGRGIVRKLHNAETAKSVAADVLRRRPCRPVGRGSGSAGATSGRSVMVASSGGHGGGAGGTSERGWMPGAVETSTRGEGVGSVQRGQTRCPCGRNSDGRVVPVVGVRGCHRGRWVVRMCTRRA